jgi:hypothetical protein
MRGEILINRKSHSFEWGFENQRYRTITCHSFMHLQTMGIHVMEDTRASGSILHKVQKLKSLVLIVAEEQYADPLWS